MAEKIINLAGLSTFKTCMEDEFNSALTIIDTKIEATPIVSGSGTKSVQQKGTGSEAMSDSSIATGVNRRKLNISNEEELTGKGVSYCAICDGGFYKNKIVAVNGGGNTAIEDALYLADVAKKVYLIHRRDTFKAEQKYIDELKNKDNVEFVLNSNIIGINGKDYVESIDINEDGQERNIPINGLFIAIGQEPNNDNFKNIIELENGYVKSSDGVHTNCKGIYVAGDTRVKDLRQLTTAVSDGATAATVAIKEMEDNYGKRN